MKVGDKVYAWNYETKDIETTYFGEDEYQVIGEVIGVRIGYVMIKLITDELTRICIEDDEWVFPVGTGPVKDMPPIPD